MSEMPELRARSEHLLAGVEAMTLDAAVLKANLLELTSNLEALLAQLRAARKAQR